MFRELQHMISRGHTLVAERSRTYRQLWESHKVQSADHPRLTCLALFLQDGECRRLFRIVKLIAGWPAMPTGYVHDSVYVLCENEALLADSFRGIAGAMHRATGIIIALKAPGGEVIAKFEPRGGFRAEPRASGDIGLAHTAAHDDGAAMPMNDKPRECSAPHPHRCCGIRAVRRSA